MSSAGVVGEPKCGINAVESALSNTRQVNVAQLESSQVRNENLVGV